MYTVVIIDDEIYTLNLLKEMIDWESFGFSLAGAFNNSQKAFQFIKENNIDVIITDIKMPVVSGIDIAKYCYENSLNTKIVFLSGFQLFDYAQQGIKYNVSDFLTKPITKAELEKTLLNIFSKLQASKNENVFKNYMFHTTIHKHITDIFSSGKKDLTALNKCEIPIDFNTANYAYVSFSINNSDEFYQQTWIHGRERLVSALEQLINMSYIEAYATLANFYDVCFDIYMISKPCVTSDNFNHFISDFTNKLQITLKECIGMDTLISSIFVTDSIDSMNANLQSIDKKTNNDKAPSGENALTAAKDFIDIHYAEHINLSDISKMIGFSPRYFSVLFRNQFNISFSDYLSNVRLDTAKNLLENTDTKISCIPALIGLSDFSNFSKRFKEYTGLSPSEYRNNYRKP